MRTIVEDPPNHWQPFERPLNTPGGHGYWRRTCPTCQHHVASVWSPIGADLHLCRRDGELVEVRWLSAPGGMVER